MTWVEVVERLPSRTETVLVASPTMLEPGLAFYDKSGEGWYTCEHGDTWKDFHGSCDISHWMPLPEMPQ